MLARSVADAAAAYDVIAVHDPTTWFSPPPPPLPYAWAIDHEPPGGLRVGVVRQAPGDLVDVDPACLAAVDLLVAELLVQGHEQVEPVLALPTPDELAVAFGTLWNTGCAYFDDVDMEQLEPLNATLREAARAVDSVAYCEALVTTQKISRQLVASIVGSCDLLVTPTMACLPPPIGAWRAGMDTDPMMGMFNVFPMGIFTSLFNITGLPAISLPVHVDEATGLPVGVQIVAAPWKEDLLLQVARQLEDRLRWQDRRPQVR